LTRGIYITIPNTSHTLKINEYLEHLNSLRNAVLHPVPRIIVRRVILLLRPCHIPNTIVAITPKVPKMIASESERLKPFLPFLLLNSSVPLDDDAAEVLVDIVSVVEPCKEDVDVVVTIDADVVVTIDAVLAGTGLVVGAPSVVVYGER